MAQKLHGSSIGIMEMDVDMTDECSQQGAGFAELARKADATGVETSRNEPANEAQVSKYNALDTLGAGLIDVVLTCIPQRHQLAAALRRFGPSAGRGPDR
jgi:hypothetical protein